MHKVRTYNLDHTFELSTVFKKIVSTVRAGAHRHHVLFGMAKCCICTEYGLKHLETRILLDNKFTNIKYLPKSLYTLKI